MAKNKELFFNVSSSAAANLFKRRHYFSERKRLQQRMEKKLTTVKGQILQQLCIWGSDSIE